MTRPLNIVFIGLTLSSSWGNGHATTYRSLLRGLHGEGHEVLFLECDVPWYANRRDLAEPDFCTLRFYRDVDELLSTYSGRLRQADAVIVGSYLPDGVEVIDALLDMQLQALCFYDIDTPVTLAGIERGSEDYLARRQIPRFDVYFSFSGGEVLHRLGDRYGARRAEALYCSADPARYRPTEEAPLWDLGYMGTYSADRQPALEALLLSPARELPQMRFVVAGAQYPDDIDWPANVERIEHLPPAEHATFFGRQRFTLNLTRADMVALGWAPSVRLFEAGACATPVISDRWQGIEELFPDGEAILLAQSGRDVVCFLSETGEAARQAIGARAHDIVLRDHSAAARARQFTGVLRSLERNSRRQRAAPSATAGTTPTEGMRCDV